MKSTLTPKKIRLSRIFTLLLLSSFIYLGCRKNNLNPEPIQNVPVNITINLALPSYVHLLDPGTHVYENGGIKGVVIVHHTDDRFYAFDRTCSYRPNDDCSRVEVDSSVLVFRCGESQAGGFVKCCNSRFWMDGEVLEGPATFGLKHYQVIRSGNILSVKN